MTAVAARVPRVTSLSGRTALVVCKDVTDFWHETNEALPSHSSVSFHRYSDFIVDNIVTTEGDLSCIFFSISALQASSAASFHWPWRVLPLPTSAACAVV